MQLMKSHLNKISLSATDQERHDIQKRLDTGDMSQTFRKMYQLLKVRNLYNVYIKTDILSSKNKLSSTMKIQKYSNLQHELIQDITDVSLYTNKPAGLLIGAVIVQITICRGVTKVNVFLLGFTRTPRECIKVRLAAGMSPCLAFFFFFLFLFYKLSTDLSSNVIECLNGWSSHLFSLLKI